RLHIDAGRRGKFRDDIKHALLGRLGSGKNLVEPQATRGIDLHQVGERAAGIDAEISRPAHRRVQARPASDWERVPQVASVPPSTRMSMPVMKEAPFDTKNSTALAWSCGSPSRPRGISSKLRAPAASIAPTEAPVLVGDTELTRILCGASSTASARVKLRMPPLAVV